MIRPLTELRKELQYLKMELRSLNSPIVFSHNDLLLGNVIFNENKKRVTFIDYEYADYNYQAFDIGNHFAEFVGKFDYDNKLFTVPWTYFLITGISEIDYSRYPSKEFQVEWLREYLDTYHSRDVNEEDIETLYMQVNKFVLASHFFWGLWALIQAEYSNIDFDFLE